MKGFFLGGVFDMGHVDMVDMYCMVAWLWDRRLGWAVYYGRIHIHTQRTLLYVIN